MKLLIQVYGEEDNWSVKTTGDGVAAYNDCVNTLGIAADEIVKIEKITDPLNRLIMKCVYVDMGYYTEGIGFHVDRIVKQIGGGHNIEKVVKRCVPTSSTDSPEDQIIKVESCLKMEKVGGYQD